MEVYMKNNRKNSLMTCSQEVFNELYIIDSIVQMTKKTCQDYEFSGQYYGIPVEKSIKLSTERNNYINMLNLLSEKISNIMKLNLLMEKEITLQQNTDNCRR